MGSDLFTVPGVEVDMKFECGLCGYIYDEEVGDADAGVSAGTSWADLPDDWVCPDCGAGKEDFLEI